MEPRGRNRSRPVAKAAASLNGQAPEERPRAGVFTEDGNRKIMIASLRYLDTFTKIDGRWYFAERTLILDWSETRFMTAPEAASAT